MKTGRLVLIAAALLVAAGCSGPLVGPVAPSQAGILTKAASAAAPESRSAGRDYAVREVRVLVPEGLSVSEANSYYPIADIVWRGDPRGDRKSQVADILRTAFEAGTAGLAGDTPVVATLTLRRFHSLTERTRYTVGGVHSIRFDLEVTHARTGAVLEPSRWIVADLEGLGGEAALRADERGEGQKVRITRHLTDLALRELGPLPGDAD